jgi:hypothetical protein
VVPLCLAFACIKLYTNSENNDLKNLKNIFESKKLSFDEIIGKIFNKFSLTEND